MQRSRKEIQTSLPIGSLTDSNWFRSKKTSRSNDVRWKLLSVNVSDLSARFRPRETRQFGRQHFAGGSDAEDVLGDAPLFQGAVEAAHQQLQEQQGVNRDLFHVTQT